MRYIKGQPLQNITIKSTIDFAQWKELMDAKEPINQCLDYKAGNSITWKIGNGKQNLGIIIEALRTKAPKDTIALTHTCLQNFQLSLGESRTDN